MCLNKDLCLKKKKKYASLQSTQSWIITKVLLFVLKKLLWLSIKKQWKTALALFSRLPCLGANYQTHFTSQTPTRSLCFTSLNTHRRTLLQFQKQSKKKRYGLSNKNAKPKLLSTKTYCWYILELEINHKRQAESQHVMRWCAGFFTMVEKNKV